MVHAHGARRRGAQDGIDSTSVGEPGSRWVRRAGLPHPAGVTSATGSMAALSVQTTAQAFSVGTAANASAADGSSQAYAAASARLISIRRMPLVAARYVVASGARPASISRR